MAGCARISGWRRICGDAASKASTRCCGAAARPEAGAIFVKVDQLDGTASLYGPAPQSLVEDGRGERLFTPVLADVPAAEIEERMRRELRFDPDLWLVEIEDRAGRHFLACAEEGRRGVSQRL